MEALTQDRVQLCGALSAELGRQRVDTLLPGRKGRLLFACLVIERDRALSRGELIEMIWHDKPPVDPDATLATLLTRMRAAVGRERIHGREDLRLELSDGAWVDWEVALSSVGEAERLLAAGDAGAALELATAAIAIARNPLLSGLESPWLQDCRRRLADAHAALLETAAQAALRLGGAYLPAAERGARELVRRQPYRESGYALLMEAHASRGNSAEALRVYDGLRRRLREDLGLTPAPTLTALATHLLAA